MHHMLPGICGGQKWALDPLELGMVASGVWVMGTETLSSARATRIFNQDPSLQP